MKTFVFGKSITDVINKLSIISLQLMFHQGHKYVSLNWVSISTVSSKNHSRSTIQ